MTQTETDEYYYTEDADYADYYDGDYYYEEDEYADSGVTDQGPSRGDQAPSQGACEPNDDATIIKYLMAQFRGLSRF